MQFASALPPQCLPKPKIIRGALTYTASGGGGTNCGFTTFQQCLDNVRGIGGFCDRNTQYQPPPGPHPPKLRSRYPS
jgi:hypothetical protein